PISGASTPASSIRRLISGTACAASGMLTVTRTISDPACASSMHCLAVEATSAVSVLAMDWTTTGAPPPTRTGPTRTPRVACLFLVSMRPPNLPEGGSVLMRAGLVSLEGAVGVQGARAANVGLADPAADDHRIRAVVDRFRPEVGRQVGVRGAPAGLVVRDQVANGMAAPRDAPDRGGQAHVVLPFGPRELVRLRSLVDVGAAGPRES